jgi:hypothetical protein
MGARGGREAEKERFLVPHTGNGSKDSKWRFSVCGLSLSWDGGICHQKSSDLT